MPIDLLTLGAAFLTGLLGGVHCAAMCGGIATGFAVGAGNPRAGFAPALRLNLGRILGYALAGAIVGGLGSGLLRLAQVEALALTLRVLLGAVLVLVALRMLGAGRFALLHGPAARLWQWLAPLQRRVLPANTPARQWAAGMLWGWLPCGLSTTLLMAAWLEADALHGSLLMASFGSGTLAMMLPLTWGGLRLARWSARPAARRIAGSIVLGAGLLTMAAPWLAQLPAMHALLEALGCRSLV